MFCHLWYKKKNSASVFISQSFPVSVQVFNGALNSLMYEKDLGLNLTLHECSWSRRESSPRSLCFPEPAAVLVVLECPTGDPWQEKAARPTLQAQLYLSEVGSNPLIWLLSVRITRAYNLSGSDNVCHCFSSCFIQIKGENIFTSFRNS